MIPSYKKIWRRVFNGIILLASVAILGGCATNGTDNVPSVGPQDSSSYGNNPATIAANAHLKIDAVVPVFDPNLPKDSDDWEKQGIFPELRRAEANRFALKMKSALEDTDVFGSVRVVPNSAVTGDLYIQGKIRKSNGEDVNIDITVVDISGRKWFTKKFKHKVKERFYKDIRNKSKDAYDSIFEEAAAYIVAQLRKRKPSELKRLQTLSELRFAASLSEETFSRYMRTKNGRVELVALPAADDPMLLRTKPIRVRDQLFMDQTQVHYADFSQKLDASYLAWQEQSFLNSKAIRQTKAKSLVQGIVGGLLVVAGVAAAIEGSDEASNKSTSAVVGGAAAAIAGSALLSQSFQNRAQMKVHRAALAELGQSIDIEIAPQVVEYENQTANLVGDSTEQHEQWIAFLRKIYALEATPSTEL